MTITALLAGGGAYFIAKDKLTKANFGSSINLIRNDDDGSWCEINGAQLVQGNNAESWFCAIQMPKYQEE